MSTPDAVKSTRFRRLCLLRPAWRLHAAAQQLATDTPLSDVSAALLSAPRLPTGARPEEAVWAAAWAGRLQRRLLGRLDTCLVRSLVAGALLADGPEVAVRIGVSQSHQPADLLKAHAWLTVADRRVSWDQNGDEPFEEVLALSMERVR